MESSTSSDEPTWPEILGSNAWNNLLDPLNLTLRQLILRCGDFCQATYDAFNNDSNSRFAGASRYGKANFFNKVMLQDAENYRVFEFLYATARVSVPAAFLLHSLAREDDTWDRESNWIGYVAVTSDDQAAAAGRREIYVAFRGTIRNYEWVNLLGAQQASARELLKHTDTAVGGGGGSSSSSSGADEEDGDDPKVMLGWLTMYVSDEPSSPFTKQSARSQLLATINRLREKYAGEDLSVILTGHSLGACLAILAAFDVAENGAVGVETPVTAIVFGSPQVGNRAFDDRVKSHRNLRILHRAFPGKNFFTSNYLCRLFFDPSLFSCNTCRFLTGYVDPGTEELVIDTRKSPSLKESRNTGDWHNLQGMLHVVAGWNGEDGEFEMKVKRSLALVNKSSEFLKEEYLVPGSWWVEKNKGMVRDEDGEWTLAPPDDEDLPVPPGGEDDS
ncbi:Phospholipase A1-IIdelta [Linum grandiflorum]